MTTARKKKVAPANRAAYLGSAPRLGSVHIEAARRRPGTDRLTSTERTQAACGRSLFVPYGGGDVMRRSAHHLALAILDVIVIVVLFALMAVAVMAMHWLAGVL